MAAAKKPIEQSRTRNTIVTPSGTMRELVFWPLLVFGALGFSLIVGPNHFVIL